MAEIKTVLTDEQIFSIAINMDDAELVKITPFARAIEAAVLSANAGKVDIKDGEIERLRQMVNDLRDDACDCDACSAARDYMASVESPAQQAIDAGKV